MGLHEQVDQQGLDRRAVVADLVILRRLRTTQLQTVQGALARNRRAVRPLRLELAQQHRQQRVMPQMVVIVEVLVAQRQTEHPLTNQRADFVFDQLGIAMIREALRKPVDQPDRPIRRAQQQSAGIRCDRPAIEPGGHFAASQGLEIERPLVTLCRHRAASLILAKLSSQKQLTPQEGRPFLCAVRNAG